MATGATPTPKRSIVYNDGFNIYYGAIKGGPHKWLNLERYFRFLRPNDNIVAIRYFTALVSGPTRSNQATYLRALETLPLVEIVLGLYKRKQVTCKVPLCMHAGSRVFQVQEEKRTDVNVGVQMLDDAYQDLCDRFVLVSGDSDLVPAVNIVKTRFPAKEIVLHVPARNATRGAVVELRGAVDKDRLLPLNLLGSSLFPATVIDGSGAKITKPAGW